MSQYFVLEPEVAGGWGAQTDADTSVHPPIVRALHYEFEGWLGDELLESFPCFIVTEELAETLRKAKLTGLSLSVVHITKSPEFTGELPKFYRLQPTGQVGCSDIALSPTSQLVVSKQALQVMRAHRLSHCEVSAW